MIQTTRAQFTVQLPSGEFAYLISGDAIYTHLGRIELPGFDVLYLAITNRRGFRIAGQANVDDARRGTWEWVDGVWARMSPDAPGVYPVIYDNTGQLEIATPQLNGSQGWRFCDERNVLFTGDQTLNTQRWNDARQRPPLTENMWEFSYLGGVFFGQGETGCDVLIDGTRRRLLDGDTRNIRVSYDGERWGIGISRFKENDGWRDVLSRADLLNLPITQDDVVITPDPEVPEEPEVPDYTYPDALRNQLPLVRQVRNELFPDLIDQPLHDAKKAMLFTATVAWKLRHLGVGLAKAKPGSINNVDGYVSDVVALENGVHWDVQEDGHAGKAFAAWSLEPHEQNYPAIAARWVPAVDPATFGGPSDDDEEDEDEPKPPKPPVTGSIDIGPQVQAAIAAAVKPLKASIVALEKRLTDLEARAPESPTPLSGRYAIKSASRDRYLRDDWATDTARFDRPSVGGDGELVILERV